MKIAIYRTSDGFAATTLKNYQSYVMNPAQVARYYAEDGFITYADVVECMCDDGGFSMTLDEFYFY